MRILILSYHEPCLHALLAKQKDFIIDQPMMFYQSINEMISLDFPFCFLYAVRLVEGK